MNRMIACAPASGGRASAVRRLAAAVMAVRAYTLPLSLPKSPALRLVETRGHGPQASRAAVDSTYRFATMGAAKEDGRADPARATGRRP